MAVENQNKEKSKSKIIKRVISGIVLLFLLFFIMYFGGDLLFLSSTILSIIGLVELYRVFGLANTRLGILGYIFTIVYYISIYTYKVGAILFFMIGMLIFSFIFYVVSYPMYNIKQVALTILGVFYVGIMFSFVYLIREQRGIAGKYIVWLIFISSWGCDTFAYITGLLFGKHRFLPNLSPKKTIEGCIGGVLGAGILGFLFAWFVIGKIIDPDVIVGIRRVTLSCCIGAILSMIGDLTASAIKRDYNIKDYGDLIPGHGGILDRFDSVIFTAPCFYFMFHIFG